MRVKNEPQSNYSILFEQLALRKLKQRWQSLLRFAFFIPTSVFALFVKGLSAFRRAELVRQVGPDLFSAPEHEWKKTNEFRNGIR